MFSSKLLLTSTAFAVLLVFSCKKDADDLLNSTRSAVTSPDSSGGGVTFRSTEKEDQMMVLGPRLNNPYSVAAMTRAWNNLYDPDVTALPATDLYVRFLPADLQEYKTLLELEETLDLDFDDYPLDYEILEEGGWYHDATIPADRPTWQYTVVPSDFQFPNIQYEILEELVLAPYYSHLTAESFRLTENEYESESNPEIPCSPQFCESWPCCLVIGLPCNEPCGNDPACVPGAPDWPRCLEIFVGGGGTGPNLNRCDCPIPANPRFPAGCIQVEDTQLGNEGVKHLKIVVKDGWFKRSKTETDDRGCFLVQKQHSSKVKIKIKFQNEKAKFRAVRSWGLNSIFQYAQIMKHKFNVNSPPYNNIQVLYETNDVLESNERARWYAATGNNALHEYYEFAQADGITAPPGGLDVLLTPEAGGEAAPMFDEMSANPLIFIGGAVTIDRLLSAIGIFEPLPPNITVPIANFLSVFLTIWAPDVVYNHGGGDIGRPSDQVKDNFYHEFAHTSHWNALNDNNYWIENILYVIENSIPLIGNNPPYGDGTRPGAGRCAVIEMWGFHIGPFYADRRYELDHSNGGQTPQQLAANRHIFILEEFTPNPTNPDLWIPNGVFLDCIDNNANNPPGVNDPVITDTFTGFTNSNCFQAITNSPLTVQAVRDKLSTNFLPPGVVPGSVNALFTTYGF